MKEISMGHVHAYGSWGKPLWKHEFTRQGHPLPHQVDVAVVGGGFTSLAAAAWLRHSAPEKVVAVLERHRLGSGGSGRSGGATLAETAAGSLPGLGNVLEGFQAILDNLGIQCDAVWDGVYEIVHGHPLSSDAIVLGGYTVQGVTSSVNLGRWAAEVLMGQRKLPAWNVAPGKSRAVP